MGMESETSTTLRTPSEWAVMLVSVIGMLPLPAATAEVFEAVEIATEEGADHTLAYGAERVLEIRIYLDLNRQHKQQQ